MPGNVPIIEPCPACSQSIDVSANDPFALVNCPACGETIRVRSRFNQFEIKDILGEGGMSEVFLARDTTLDREVAIKILNRRYGAVSERIAQFEREARLTASISHPHVVRVYSVGEDQGLFYIAMELVEGGSLDERISKEGRLPSSEVAELAAQCVEGLQAAHAVGLIHRDIKPGNILFSKDGTAKIVDFGLALIADRERDESGEVWATPYYVAPEALTDQPEDFRSDMYSLGASLFHAVSGQPAHKVDTTSIKELAKIKSKQVHLRDRDPGLPAPLCSVIDRMMARDPARRHSSYERLLEDWRVCNAELVGTPDDDPTETSSSRRRRRRSSNTPFILGGLGILAAIALMAALATLGGDAEPDPSPPRVSAAAGTSQIPVVDPVNMGATISERFLGARADLLGGRYKAAASTFSEVADDPEVPLETACWSWTNAGAARLLDGRLDEARREFHSTATALQSGGDGLTPADVAFFRNLDSEMQRSLVPGDDGMAYSLSGGQAIAPLILGLKAWQLGAYDEALRLFTIFRSLEGGPAAPWVAEYQQLVDPYFADAELVRPLGQLTRTMDRPAVEKLIQSTREVQEKLQTKGRLPAALKRSIAALEERKRTLGADLAATNVARLEAIREEELEELISLVEALDEYGDEYRFSEATDILANVSFKSPEVRSSIDDQIYLWEGADQFLDQLVTDLVDIGYTGPIPGAAEGSTLTGTVIEANRDEILIQLETGQTRVSIDRLRPTVLLSLGWYFIGQIRDSTDYYRRLELMVAFAERTHQEKYTKTLSSQLMEENRAFRVRWMRVIESSTGG